MPLDQLKQIYLIENYVLLVKDLYFMHDEEQMMLRRVNDMFLNPRLDLLEDVLDNPASFK